MKIRSLLYFAGLLLVVSVVSLSCKKKTTDTHPTPSNYRLSSYSKTSWGNLVSFSVGDTLNENYSFTYDANQRVVAELYTSNNTLTNATTARQSIAFTYVGDTIYKVYTDLRNNVVFERDTFIINSSNQVIAAYMPGFSNLFDYYGKLPVRRTENYYTATTSITKVSTYTSYNSDLLKLQYDGTLTANFSGLTDPISVTWYDYKPVSPGTIVVVPINEGSGSTATLSGYVGDSIYVVATDVNGATDTGSYPGRIYQPESYLFYQNLPMRSGDYMQINSFTQYGINIYQNNHMLQQITSTGKTTKIAYDIDAYSKVTQARVSSIDSMGNTTNATYNYQYETTY